MMKHYLPIVFLCTALFTACGAKAQDKLEPNSTVVPAKIQGNWALPDCRNYDETLMISRHFYLKSTKAGSQFWPITPISKKKDYWLAEIEGEDHPVRLEEDAVLKIGILPDPPPKKWPSEWDALPLDSKHEYMGCADIPALFPDPLVRVMVRMDKIEKSCRSMSEDCKHLLFQIVDDDKNKKISIKEMRMAGAMLSGFAALVENHTLTRNALDRAFYDSFRESGRIFKVIAGDKRELAYKDFAGFLEKANSVPLNKGLGGVGMLFPAFRSP